MDLSNTFAMGRIRDSSLGPRCVERLESGKGVGGVSFHTGNGPVRHALRNVACLASYNRVVCQWYVRCVHIYACILKDAYDSLHATRNEASESEKKKVVWGDSSRRCVQI